MKKKGSLLLSLLLIFSFWTQAFAADADVIGAVVSDTASYLYQTVQQPQVGSIGGEWTVLGLARSGEDIPKEYFQRYYETVEEYVTARGGVVDDKKYTEYARLILALTAIGKNPADVAGCNLLTPLGDYEGTVSQGINGSIWALLALDSADYAVPYCPTAKVQATRELYVNHILAQQTPDGGWSLSGETADPDITAMALQALANYQENEAVKAATEKALGWMSEKQLENGGFASWGTENSESCAQMIVALCQLGLSPEDPRFVKKGTTVLDYLLTYYQEGRGFCHSPGGDETSLMATEQCFYSLVAAKRALEGKNSLYRMSDAIAISDENQPTIGLAGKHPDVQKTSLVSPGKTFGDISGHEGQTAIESLAARNIISGKTELLFEPDATMTRAEFATIIVRGLGLPEKQGGAFEDVKPGDWFEGYVNTAYCYGIVSGVSDTEFDPEGTITREEAAAMVARAAKLCGMDPELGAFEARNILAGFSDYVTISDWAVSSLAFCYDKGIFPDDKMEIKPREAVTRAEIAQMLFGMLSLSKLI